MLNVTNVTRKEIIPGVTDSSYDDVLGVTRPSVAKFATVTCKSNQLVKHVTHRNITNEGVTDDIDHQLPGVTHTSGDLLKVKLTQLGRWKNQ